LQISRWLKVFLWQTFEERITSPNEHPEADREGIRSWLSVSPLL
jgi:hypothetical protein